MYFEMHKHSHYSLFDGFDKIKNIVAYAKELGQQAVGISDHGNLSGAIQLYSECKKAGIKPVVGCEVYFQPVFASIEKRYHLCLYAMNQTGYRNLCKIVSEANTENFYRYGHVTFEILDKYNEGLICTSACIAGFVPQLLLVGNKQKAVKAIYKFKSLFGNNFYFEIQPIKIDDNFSQEKVNEALMQFGVLHGVNCILSSDSHFIKKEDFDSYLMMHRLSKLGKEKGEGYSIEQIEETYKERYMHSEKEIVDKFEKMYKFYPGSMLKNMENLYHKINLELDFSNSIPVFSDVSDSYSVLKNVCVKEFKNINKYNGIDNQVYVDRLKYELAVIKKHDLCDYFLIVYDYVKWAKENNLYIGPGRGSVGGSLLAYLLGITKIDAVELETDFARFLRPDKKKMPDIDLDFENQDAVMEYILNKYNNKATKVITFGYYKSANLINDLCKAYEISSYEATRIKQIIQSVVPEKSHVEFEDIDYNDIMRNKQVQEIEKNYKGLIKHFAKLCGQVKYYGQHPAGVLVTREKTSEYVPLMKIKNNLVCSYDKYDVEEIGMLKFDILALKTLSVLHEIEDITGDVFDRNELDSEIKEQMYKNFSAGETKGIFQLGANAARSVLQEIGADNIQDIIAAISCNRPGTLKLGMHKIYAENKKNVDKSSFWYQYTKDAYGSIIYQEHIMRICAGLAKMEMQDIDKLMKFKFSESEKEALKEKFVEGALKHSKVSRSVSEELFNNMALYMFNKAHGTGYALISEWQMYHKVKNPLAFWLATLKHEADEQKRAEFMYESTKQGVIFFLAHVNYSADYSIRKLDEGEIIQIGYKSIKNVGEKAAKAIEDERLNGAFKSYDDFYKRCKGRAVTSRVVDSLLEHGALEFDKKIYLKRVIKFNSANYAKGNKTHG